MSWGSWLLWGFAATVVLTTVLAASQGLGMTRMNIPYLLGTMVTPDRDRAKLYGVALHLVNGWVFSLIYVAAFHAANQFSWWFGAGVGFVHGAFVLTVVMPVLPGMHPRMASDVHGPTATRQLEPPGFLAKNYGIRTPISVLLGHLVFGGILGAFYVPPASVQQTATCATARSSSCCEVGLPQIEANTSRFCPPGRPDPELRTRHTTPANLKAHFRLAAHDFVPRTLTSTVRRISKGFPVLLLTGPRQSGKTTLLHHLACAFGCHGRIAGYCDSMMRVVIRTMVLSVIMTASCSNGPERRPVSDEDVLKLFGGIEIGSHRSQVEYALGSPIRETPEMAEYRPLEGRILAWYLESPPLSPEMSPFMPGAIGVVYVRDRVVEKSLNPFVRR